MSRKHDGSFEHTLEWGDLGKPNYGCLDCIEIRYWDNVDVLPDIEIWFGPIEVIGLTPEEVENFQLMAEEEIAENYIDPDRDAFESAMDDRRKAMLEEPEKDEYDVTMV